MLIIPAIDIADGHCVRLKQGDMQHKTVFSRDPAAMAARWERQGAQVLHIVDLDGAMAGSPANLDALKAILKVVKAPVELGGGLRTRDDVARVLDMGVKWAIMGTSALSNRPELERCVQEFGDRLIVGIDARDGRVAVAGWTETSKVTALALARRVGRLGVGRIIFTDIATDGMLQGPNIESLRKMVEGVAIPLIASGGITTLDDVRKLKLLEPLGVIGCIVGRALYSGTIDLAEAVRAGGE